MRPASEPEDTAPVKMRVDPLNLKHTLDFVDCFTHGVVDRTRRLLTIAFSQLPERNRKPRIEPSPVASGGTEASDPLFQDNDLQARLTLEQVIGRPQARKASAENGDIGLVGPLEGGARRQVVTARFQPEAVLTIHASRVECPGHGSSSPTARSMTQRQARNKPDAGIGCTSSP
jgi:hypothetical protein